MKKKPKLELTLTFRDHGEKCPRRGIPLVDVYLTGSGPSDAEGCWLHKTGISLPFAAALEKWFAEQGVTIDKQECSTDPEHSRSLFS